MKVFFLSLMTLLCLGCNNQRQEKAMILSNELKSVPIHSSVFDSLMIEVNTLTPHQQVKVCLEVASRKELGLEGMKRQEQLLIRLSSIASEKEQKEILKQRIILCQKLDLLGFSNAPLEGLRLCEKLKNNYSLSQQENREIDRFKVVFLNQQRRYKEGITILYSLLKEHCEDENIDLEIKDICAIANVFTRLGDFEKGLELYKNAYKLAVDNNLIERQQLCLHSIIEISCKLGFYEDAILYYCRADSLLSLNSATYLRLSECYLQLQKFDSARVYLAKMNEKLPKKNVLMYYYKMADTYISEDKEDSAAYYLSEAMEIIKDRKQSNSNFSLPLYIMPVYASYASLLQKNGKYKQASEAFHLVEPLMKDTVTESVWLKQKVESLYLYSSFCRATRQYEKAADLMVYRDSILKIYNDAKNLRDAQNWVGRFEIQELTTAYDTQQERLKISYRINSFTLLCAAAFGVGLVIVSFIASRLFRQKRKIVASYESKLKEFSIPQEPVPQKRQPPTPQELLYVKAEKTVTAQKLFLNSSLTLDDLAKEMGTNRSSLSACINKHTGGNFNQWINGFRIQHAKELIPTSDNLKTLSEIVGFGSYNTFSSCFKEYTGYTPKEYLRMCKSDNILDANQDILLKTTQ